MIEGTYFSPDEKYDETLLSQINHHLGRLYSILENTKNSVNAEKVQLQQLISDISHQLKTPLTSLMVMVDLLKNEKNNEHESLTYEDGSEGDFVEDPRDNYLQMIDLESLKQNLAALPRRHRDTILFRYVYGLKCKEIADLFRITERSVKNRCREARELLRQMMEADEL